MANLQQQQNILIRQFSTCNNQLNIFVIYDYVGL